MRYQWRMPQVLLRNVSQAALDELKQRAARRGLSAEGLHRAVFEREFAPRDDAAWWAEADRLRKATVRAKQTPSEILIREDRDR